MISNYDYFYVHLLIAFSVFECIFVKFCILFYQLTISVYDDFERKFSESALSVNDRAVHGLYDLLDSTDLFERWV